MKTLLPTLLVALVAVGVAWAVGYLDVSAGPPLQAGSAHWRDAPTSNDYGPGAPSVVWLETVDAKVDGGCYHRMLCPDLRGVRIPQARSALDDSYAACPRCRP